MWVKPCLDQKQVCLTCFTAAVPPKLATPAASCHLFISHISVTLRHARARPSCEYLSSTPPRKQVKLSMSPTARNEVRMGRSAMPLQRKLGVSPGRTGGLYSGTFQNRDLLLRRLCCRLHVGTCRFGRSARACTKLQIPPVIPHPA